MGLTASDSTTAITLSSSVAIQNRDLVVLIFGGSNWGFGSVPPIPYVSSVTDGVNTYNRALIENTQVPLTGTSQYTSHDVEVWYAFNCVAISSPNITANVVSGANAMVSIGCIRCGGINVAAPLDQANATLDNTVYGTAFSSPSGSTPVSTGGLAASHELVIGAFVMDNHQSATNATTEGSGFNTLFDGATPASAFSGQSIDPMHAAYKIAASAVAVTYAPSWSNVGYTGSGATDVSCPTSVIVTFKAAPSGNVMAQVLG